MVKFILIILSFFLPHQEISNCELKDVEYIKAIRSLYSKGVFDKKGKSLRLIYDKSLEEIGKIHLKKISLNDKTIKILKYNLKKPWLIFTAATLAEESPGKQTLKF